MQETTFVDKDFSPQKLVELLRGIYWEAELSEPDEKGEPAAFQVQVVTPTRVGVSVQLDDDVMRFWHYVLISQGSDPRELLRIHSKFLWSACITYHIREEISAATITYELPIPTGTPFAAIIRAFNWFGMEVWKWYVEAKEILEE